MPAKIRPKFTLPTAATLAEPKSLLRLGLGILAIANLIAAAFAFHIFSASPEALNTELASAIAARQAAQVRLNRSRSLTSNIERGKSEGEKFLATSMMDRRHTYSTILNELYEMAKSAGMDKAGETFPPLDPIPGSDNLDMMSISLTLEGNYAQLVKFVNLLDRSPRFLIIEALTVTPRAKSDVLSVTVKLDTFVKEDNPPPPTPIGANLRTFFSENVLLVGNSISANPNILGYGWLKLALMPPTPTAALVGRALACAGLQSRPPANASGASS